MQSKFGRGLALSGGRLPTAPVCLALGSIAIVSVIIGLGAASALSPNSLGSAPLAVQRTKVTHAITAKPAPSPPSNSPTRRFTGRVGENLTDSMRAAGVPDLQGRQYVWVLSRAIQLSGGLSVDDRFDLILQRDAEGKLGQLLYVGLARVGRSDVELMKWTDGRNIIWVNGDGVGGEDSSGFSLPVHGRMTSGFGNRFHPILGYERFHAGVDLAAAAGTPILAAADGRVREAGWRGGYGQEVEITHGSGIETRYGHMSRIAASIGQVVHKGQIIGWVGSTGLSTGPHVHFEVTKDGRPINPLSAKMNDGPGHLEGEKLHQFDDALRGLLLGSGERG